MKVPLCPTGCRAPEGAGDPQSAPRVKLIDQNTALSRASTSLIRARGDVCIPGIFLSHETVWRRVCNPASPPAAVVRKSISLSCGDSISATRLAHVRKEMRPSAGSFGRSPTDHRLSAVLADHSVFVLPIEPLSIVRTASARPVRHGSRHNLDGDGNSRRNGRHLIRPCPTRRTRQRHSPLPTNSA